MTKAFVPGQLLQVRTNVLSLWLLPYPSHPPRKRKITIPKNGVVMYLRPCEASDFDHENKDHMIVALYENWVGMIWATDLKKM